MKENTYIKDYSVYNAGHPWYYHLNGPVILPTFIGTSEIDFELPSDPEKVEVLRKQIKEDLDSDINRYKEVCRCLDPSDIDSCTNVGLKHNHILYNRSYLAFINARRPVQTSLF